MIKGFKKFMFVSNLCEVKKSFYPYGIFQLTGNNGIVRPSVLHEKLDFIGQSEGITTFSDTTGTLYQEETDVLFHYYLSSFISFDNL